LHLLIHLTVNKQPAMKKKGSNADALSKIFQNFNELILPDAAAAAAEKKLMELPGILKINNQFFIKIDDTALLLSSNVNSLEQAIAWLVVYYHVLNLNFPPQLKFLFGFLEKLFKIAPNSESVNVKKLFAFCSAD